MWFSNRRLSVSFIQRFHTVMIPPTYWSNRTWVQWWWGRWRVGGWQREWLLLLCQTRFVEISALALLVKSVYLHCSGSGRGYFDPEQRGGGEHGLLWWQHQSQTEGSRGRGWLKYCVRLVQPPLGFSSRQKTSNTFQYASMNWVLAKWAATVFMGIATTRVTFVDSLAVGFASVGKFPAF